MGEKGVETLWRCRRGENQAGRDFGHAGSSGQGAAVGVSMPRPCFLCAFEVFWPDPAWGDRGRKEGRTHASPTLWSEEQAAA